MSTSLSLIISSGFVAGVPHRSPDLSVVSFGDELTLVPEPDNAYDPDAVKVIHKTSEQLLGYIPREQTCAVLEALRAGLVPETRVMQITATKWKEIQYRTSVFVTLA